MRYLTGITFLIALGISLYAHEVKADQVDLLQLQNNQVKYKIANKDDKIITKFKASAKFYSANSKKNRVNFNFYAADENGFLYRIAKHRTFLNSKRKNISARGKKSLSNGNYTLAVTAKTNGQEVFLGFIDKSFHFSKETGIQDIAAINN